MGNIFQKSLSVYDTWFGFYDDFKKGTLGCSNATTGVNGLISSTIENKMSIECLYKWEEENTKRKRDLSLPPSNKHIQWILNRLGDYIQTSKRSTIKMHMGEEKKKGSAGSKPTGMASQFRRPRTTFTPWRNRFVKVSRKEACFPKEGFRCPQFTDAYPV